MRCDELQEEMAAFAVNELSIEKMNVIAEHILTCTACHSWYQEVLDLSDIWAQGDQPVPGLDLVPNVLRRIEAEVNLPANRQSNGISNAQKLPKHHTSSLIPFYHYGLAASLAFALFHFGVFEHLGLDISQSTAFISQNLQSLAQYVSKLQV